MPLRHIVVFRLAAEDTTQRARDAALIKRELETLDGRIPQLRSLQVGVDSIAAQGSWDVVLIADFDDDDGLQAYQRHPAHLSVIGRTRHLHQDRAAVDFEF